MTKSEFVKAWDYHLNQLTKLRPGDKTDYDRIIEIKTELKAIVDREAYNLFGKNEYDETAKEQGQRVSAFIRGATVTQKSVTTVKGQCLGYCGDNNVELFHDPKSPPMDTELCLCKDCQGLHAVDAIEELEQQAQEIKDGYQP